MPLLPNKDDCFFCKNIMLDELLIEYVEQFNENFPIFCCMGMPDEKIIGIIKQALKEGVPYKVDNLDLNEALY